MAAAAGYKFRARNMTAMGVKILGTVLNKPFLQGTTRGEYHGMNCLPVFRSTELGISDLGSSVIMLWLAL